MPEYKCIKRLKTSDGVIHEIGTVVSLTGADETGAIQQGAVVSLPSTITQLQQEKAQIDQQIATMEQEGGKTS